MRLRQWNADLIGLVLRQSNNPEIESSQQNVTMKNNALVITRYSRACMFKQFQQCQKCQFGLSQELICNSSLSSIHNSGLWFWQLELYTTGVSKLCNQIYHLVNLAWPIDFGILQKFLQLRLWYSLHLCGESFKKIPKPRDSNLRAVKWFDFSSSVKIFLTSQGHS